MMVVRVNLYLEIGICRVITYRYEITPLLKEDDECCGAQTLCIFLYIIYYITGTSQLSTKLVVVHRVKDPLHE